MRFLQATTISELFTTYIHHQLLEKCRRQPSLRPLAGAAKEAIAGSSGLRASGGSGAPPQQPLLYVESPHSSPRPRRRSSRRATADSLDVADSTDHDADSSDGRVVRARAGSVQFERDTLSGEFTSEDNQVSFMQIARFICLHSISFFFISIFSFLFFFISIFFSFLFSHTYIRFFFFFFFFF